MFGQGVTMTNRDDDTEQGFRVVDRRRFEDSGEMKPGSSPIESFEEVAPSPVKEADTTSKHEVDSRTRQDRNPELLDTDSHAGLDTDEIDFSSFVIGLANQTLMMLGEIPMPDTGMVAVNREAAKQSIDILGMLEAKTKGNLSGQEANLLAEVLASLRLAFVQLGAGRVK